MSESTFIGLTVSGSVNGSRDRTKTSRGRILGSAALYLHDSLILPICSLLTESSERFATAMPDSEASEQVISPSHGRVKSALQSLRRDAAHRASRAAVTHSLDLPDPSGVVMLHEII